MILLDEENSCEEELMFDDDLTWEEELFFFTEDDDVLEDELVLALFEELDDSSMLLEIAFSASLSGFATDAPSSLHAINNITAIETINLLLQKLIQYSLTRTILMNNI